MILRVMTDGKTHSRGNLLKKDGQVMILTVLALGGTLLGATTVAGLLMLYQIRQSTDLANSAKAIFAADAGIEWGLYNLFCEESSTPKNPCPRGPLGAFTNNASVDVVCRSGAGAVISCSDLENVREIRSVGRAGTASRAFRLSL